MDAKLNSLMTMVVIIALAVIGNFIVTHSKINQILEVCNGLG